jgi:ribosomal protein L29
MSNYKDLQKKNDKDLVAFVKEQRETLRKARFDAVGAGSADVKEVRTAKKNIARSLTELNARKRDQAKKTA